MFHLAEDPAQGGHNARLRERAKGLIEALTALEAVLVGMIGGPLRRHSAEVDFSCFGPAVSYGNVEFTSSFKMQLDEVKKRHSLTTLHKDLSKPLLLDVKHPLAGQAQGGAKSVLKQLKVPGVVVLLDACWFSPDEITSLKIAAAEFKAEDRLVMFHGCMTFEFLQNVHDRISET